MSTDQTLAALWEETFGVEALEAHSDAKTFFQIADNAPPSEETVSEADGITLGTRIGKGGFAYVFTAHQHTLRREVAVKQIRDQHRGDYLRFFHHEVWLTAGLNHPNILPIHDLVRIDGCPSLVMKRVNGEAWDELLDEHRFKKTIVLHHEIQRLVDVCDAVAFAHSRGVLHLDLKPANVMCGAFGETLVMDWGCAALFDDRLWGDQPDLPRTSKITKPFGTPAFMAPELARGEGNALGPHTDIYLLGAILHQLLAGTLLRQGVTVRSTIEMAVLGERQPLPEDAPQQLADLCRHATEPEISARLADLSAFRGTLQHWLDTRESQALTDRALETLSELEKSETLTAAQRQEGTQLLGVFEQAGRSGMNLSQAIDGEWRMRRLLAQTALKNGEPGVARVIAMPMPQDLRENIQKRAQELQAQQSQAVSDDAWIGHALSKDGGRSIERILLQILKNQQQALGDEHPSTLNSMQDTAALYAGQGRYRKSVGLYEALLGVHRRILGAEHSRTLNTMRLLAIEYSKQGKYALSEQLLTQVMNEKIQRLGLEHPATLDAMRHLASVHKDQGKYHEAEPLNLKVLEVRSRTLGSEHPDTLGSINSLAELYVYQGRYAEAEPLILKVLETRKRILGEEHPDTLRNVFGLANLYKATGQYAEASQLLLQLVDAGERTLGAEHPDTLRSISSLSAVYIFQGRYSDAESLLLKVLESRKRILGEEHPDTLRSINNLAILYDYQGRYSEVEPLYLRALEASERSQGSEHPETLVFAHNLAQIYRFQRRYEEAETLCLRVLEARERSLGPRHPNTLNSVNNLAVLYQAQRRYSDAEKYHLRARAVSEQTLGPEHPTTLNSDSNLALLYRSQGKYSESEKLFVRVSECRRRTLGEAHPDTLSSLHGLAVLYTYQGHHSRAEHLLRKVLRHREQVLGPNHRETMLSVNALAWALVDQNADPPRSMFARMARYWTDGNNWLHHLAQMGLALCTLKELGDDTDAMNVLKDLSDLFGDDHERVVKARKRIELYRQ